MRKVWTSLDPSATLFPKMLYFTEVFLEKGAPRSNSSGKHKLNKAGFCRGRRRKDQENKTAAPANVYRCLPCARRAAT